MFSWALTARFRRLVTVGFLVLVVVLPGCGGVLLSPEYSQLLDEAAVLSRKTADLALDGQMTPEQMAASLDGQAKVWARFQDARDGVAGAE